MLQTLSVIIVIDSPTPARWVHELLDRLADNSRLRLSLWISAADDKPDADVRKHDSGLLDRLSEKLMQRLIDRPRFTDDPWQRSTLPADSNIRMLDDARTLTSDSCDVILNLTTKAPDDLSGLPLLCPIWDAHLASLDARVTQTLLERAPLNWVHLWEGCQAEEIPGFSSTASHAMPDTRLRYRRLASHALPRQSYSLRDLRVAAWSCLPALFASRLNWLAMGSDPRCCEYTAAETSNTALIDAEVRLAHQQAEAISADHFALKTAPGLLQLGRTVYLALHRSVRRMIDRVSHEQWQLAIHVTRETDIDEGAPLARLTQRLVSEYLSIATPDRTWWADPHLYRHDGNLYVFFEEMAVDASHGHLAVGRLHHDGRVDEVRTIMDEGSHLSYPFVFADGEQICMIPETASTRTVQLFRAQVFPDRWEKVTDLLSGVNLADSTVHHDGQRWWMFTNGMSHRSVDERDELHLYHAEQLTGPWLPHPMNPVVTGVDRARMAGPIIEEHGKLYRTSQYGAVRYGHGINLHRIDRLDPNSYCEVTIGRLLPEPRSRWLACHSTSHIPGLTIIDRATRRPGPR